MLPQPVIRVIDKILPDWHYQIVEKIHGAKEARVSMRAYSRLHQEHGLRMENFNPTTDVALIKMGFLGELGWVTYQVPLVVDDTLDEGVIAIAKSTRIVYLDLLTLDKVDTVRCRFRPVRLTRDAAPQQ